MAKQSCNFFRKWNLNFQKIGKNASKFFKISKKLKNYLVLVYYLTYVFGGIKLLNFQILKNYFLNSDSFWKCPWDSGTHQVWVYHEKFNIWLFGPKFLAMRIDLDISGYISDISGFGYIRHMLDLIAPHFSDRQSFRIRMADPYPKMSMQC